MGRAVDYVQRAGECRRFAGQYPNPEDWGHFLEMVETWEMLFKHQQEGSRRQTIALADRFRNALSLSDVAPSPAADDNNENAA
jgi:hypothetical protein